MCYIKKFIATSAFFAVCLASMGQQPVRGTVKDTDGNPLIGVTISADGKPVSVTDLDGNFTLPSASPSTKLEVSYVGYQSQSIVLGKSKT